MTVTCPKCKKELRVLNHDMTLGVLWSLLHGESYPEACRDCETPVPFRLDIKVIPL